MPLITRRLSFLLIACAITLTSTSVAQETVDVAAYKGAIKLACVGDSITQGVGAEKGKSWPDQIQTS